LNNNKRFILLFAPINRTYRSSFKAKESPASIPPYNRNHLEFSASVEVNVAFLKKWQEGFMNDGFDFDYHYMWAHHRDPGGFQISKILYSDIKNLSELNLKGLTSCQVQRAMFPNALGLTVMGRTLWNDKYNYEDITQEYFKNVYGTGWEKAKDYLEQLSNLYFRLNLENNKQESSDEKAEICQKAKMCMKEFEPELALYIKGKIGIQQKAWRYLKLHMYVWQKITAALYSLYIGDHERASNAWKNHSLWLWKNEPLYQSLFDVFNFTRTFDEIFFTR
jgi:hypothetical protein